MSTKIIESGQEKTETQNTANRQIEQLQQKLAQMQQQLHETEQTRAAEKVAANEKTKALESQLAQVQQQVIDYQQRTDELEAGIEEKEQSIERLTAEIEAGRIERQKAFERSRREEKLRMQIRDELQQIEQAEAVTAITKTAVVTEPEEVSTEEKLQKGAEEIQTAACDCCGNEAVPVTELTKIDSGHIFCRTCIKELRGE
jgi:chromosome segregation ATPase